VDERLRHLFTPHECHSARYAGLVGLQNGQLLSAAEAAGFQVIITTDQSIPDQQDLSLRRISILILRAPTNRIEDLKRLVPLALRALELIEPGQVVKIRG
jgi:hypothetical protein